MKKNILYIVLFFVFFAVGFLISKEFNKKNTVVKRTQILLGTVVVIQVRNFDEDKANDAISKAFAEIKRIEDLFTTYRNAGEIYKINHSSDTVFTVDDEVFGLLKTGDSLWQISGGAFDLALESVTKVWGFDSDEPAVPENDSLKNAMENSGWKNVELIERKKIKRKNKVKFNFGAIAKGYAVDRAIEILKNENVTGALVNAGGEIKVIGKDWKVGVQHPRNPNSLILKLDLKEKSVATSGDYEQYFEVNGIRYHHIFDPATGFPAKGLQSVTVISKSNTWADAVSTAAFVLGKEKGFEFVKSLKGTEAFFVDSLGNEKMTDGFNKYLIEKIIDSN